MSSIATHLWFEKDAIEAVTFYTEVIPNSKIISITNIPVDTPSGPAGSVPIIEFELDGAAFQAIGAGPLDPFNHAISIVANCDSQAEIDRIWNALLEGGQAEQCGWLRDRYGLAWQIVPAMLGERMLSTDRAAAVRMCDAMMHMVKLDIAQLEAAFEG
jgi:predicted 3-demethylubiquinone-9 3-methyltransferase (glyoxalase superfamily)